MKIPILPVSAKTGSQQPLPAGTGTLGFLQAGCWVPVGTACPAGRSGQGFWAAQPDSGEPMGCFLGAASSVSGTCPSPPWGWDL